MTARLLATAIRDAFAPGDIPRWPGHILAGVGLGLFWLGHHWMRAVDDNLADFGGDS